MNSEVLIVDADDESVAALRAQLAQDGWHAHVAESATAAVDVLVSESIAVMLTDISVGPPDGDGVDLIELARKVSPTTRSILMTGELDVRSFRRALEAGALEVLPKPPTPQECETALARAMDCDQGLRGSLHGVSLMDVLQLFHLARRSVALLVGNEQGAIFFEQGDIVHADAGPQRGREALRALLAHRPSHVRSQALPAALQHTIEQPFEPLMLDLLRELDEQAQHRSLGATLPYGDSPLAAHSPAPLPATPLADESPTCVESASPVDQSEQSSRTPAETEGFALARAVDTDQPSQRPAVPEWNGIVIDDPQMREGSVVVEPPDGPAPSRLERAYASLCHSFDLDPVHTRRALVRGLVVAALAAAAAGFWFGYGMVL